MRHHAKRDANHPAIVKALRRIGATVQDLGDVGGGCPDLLVGFRGQNWLLEVKDGSLPPSHKRLTPDEVEWHACWRGQRAVVETEEQALVAIGAMKPETPF